MAVAANLMIGRAAEDHGRAAEQALIFADEDAN
jgi:hypothetical protein